MPKGLLERGRSLDVLESLMAVFLLSLSIDLSRSSTPGSGCVMPE